MRPILTLLAIASMAAGQAPLPRDVAAAHPSHLDKHGNWQEGKWKIRRVDLYRHLVRYYRGYPGARVVLPDYMRRRLVEEHARERKITVTDRDVERWMEELDAQIRKKTGGTRTLEKERKRHGMSMEEFKRRGRAAILRERVARARINERDKTRDRNKKLEESTVVLTIDELYNNASKIFDSPQLPQGIVARINKIDITEYQLGRELFYSLPLTVSLRALNDLILGEEVKLLTGNDDPPTQAELAAQRKWFLDFQMNQLRRLAPADKRGKKPRITLDMVEQVLAKRGMTLKQALANPGSRAQARARGHFRRGLGEEQLRKYYEEHKDRYGDQLRVARILIAARAQQVGNVGRKNRTLQQGKAEADALWIRATQGQDFGDLAKKSSDDMDVIRKNGGIIPLWLTAEMPTYKFSWTQANRLAEGQISKPFFSPGRGYVIVKLLKRRKALAFEALRERILEHATEEAYRRWRDVVVRAALKSRSLLNRSR